ncbi:MAG: hypothetical protein HYZ57_11815, partial [Acidobacteria bacterium]|nr:hypothetical protein [Acidobacteriota bacterium]
MPSPRRRFLKTAAGVAAAACAHDAKLVGQSGAKAAGEGKLPTLKLGKHVVSRLIIGGNPFYGYSHFNRLFSQHMVEWATPDRIMEVLRNCEQQGINTWQFSHSERTLSDLKRHRAEGGRMQWILLSHKDIEDNHKLLPGIAKLGPIGIVHHGGSAERKRRTGKIAEVREFLKAVRGSGVMVGLSTHDPEFLEQAESENWDVDFYMTALYYLTRSPEEFKKVMGGHRPIGEVYLPGDPPRMCAAIRKTKKTCLAYKVLAAGRL